LDEEEEVDKSSAADEVFRQGEKEKKKQKKTKSLALAMLTQGYRNTTSCVLMGAR
jgi:hypothetical protein